MKLCLHKSRLFPLLLTVIAIAGNALAADKPAIAPRKDYAEVARIVRPFIEQQMKEKKLPAVSIAVVDDQQIVWAEGFGFADPKAKVPATAETVYRIGSVSKLFTDIGIMQLVESGALSLDAPVSNYIPDFHPKNPFGVPITLRRLMSHQSGLLREPPVGNYFETSEPSLKQTVFSLNETELVYPPGTHVKYSNAAIGAVGYVLEEKNGRPFAKYLKSVVLAPLGMEHSSFEPEAALIRNLAKAEMWSYDGRIFDAPTFQLGMAPAGSMYSTVTDLGRFAIAMLAHGQGERGRVLKPETLDQMWQPQSPNSSGTGFGLGFRIADLDHHRMIGHGGAIYGFATSVEMLPDDKVGVIVVATKDASNGVTERIAKETLQLILDRRQGKQLAAPPATTPVPADLARKLAGRYGEGDDAVDLIYLNGKLTVLPVNGGSQLELRRLGGDPSADTSGQVLVVDSVLGYGTLITPLENAIRLRDKVLQRVQPPKPTTAPAKWKGLTGEYGWDHDTLYVFEKNGKLSVLIEWIEYEALTEVSENIFEFPKRGLYDGEKAIFTRDANGEATQVRVSGVVFKRRQIGGVSSGVFRIQPARSIAVLRKEALGDHPPAEKGDFLKPDLVELASLDPTIKLDIRYASTNNFLSEPMYSQAKAFLQRPAAEAVARANRALNKLGFGLLIHDAYRPWYVTKMFWEATPPDKRIFVANPKEGSRHNRGCAVDLSLYDLATGKPIEMVGVYDEMSERSYPGYPGGTSLQRWHRDLLRSAMEQQGFEVYEFEWWHFDYKDWRRYPILNLTFDQISGSDPKHALDGLRPFITAEMQKAKLPGLAMAVVQNGKLLCAEGFGLRDVEHNLPVTTQTLFGIGSTSKSFTALAMGILNDQGKLDWDKPVRQYLPEFQMYDPVASERMTPRDLIAHRAGFPRHDLLWYSSDFTREDLVRRLRYLQSDHDFRNGYRYNNLLVATAGYMVGKISGSTWEDLVRQRILLPLKMNNTNFSITDTQRSPDFSYPYKKDEKTGTVSRCGCGHFL